MKAFYRNGLMCAPTRAREISFTFTPRRLYRPLRSELAASTLKDHVVCARVRRLHSSCGGVDSLAANAHPCARTDAFCRCRKSRGLARPQSPFPLTTRLPCRKGDNVEQKLRFRRGTLGRQWGRGACCVHRGGEGLKWTAVVQVGFSLKSHRSAICILQNVVIRRGFFTFYTEKIVLSQSSCIFVHGMSSDGNKCTRCRTRVLRGPMKTTTSRIPLPGAVPIGTTARTRIDPLSTN